MTMLINIILNVFSLHNTQNMEITIKTKMKYSFELVINSTSKYSMNNANEVAQFQRNVDC